MRKASNTVHRTNHEKRLRRSSPHPLRVSGGGASPSYEMYPSPDSVESHAAFAKNHALPFTLLADPGGRVGASFGLKKTLGLLPGRATFVIDREQRVRLSFSSLLDAKAHIRNALFASRDH